MTSTFTWFFAVALVAVSAPVEAQLRNSNRVDRVELARIQGVPPGHLPSANQCRVWYNNRPAGRQPSPTTCRQAEAMAARDRTARVIYGENTYWNARDRQYGYGSPGNERAVRRGSVRDPRSSGNLGDYRRDNRSHIDTPAFQNGYRDGLTKGRDDGEDRDRFDVDRHSWYRSANRGYESRYGGRASYQEVYRRGFEAGYAEGYRVYARR
jgi:hypothetical protein